MAQESLKMLFFVANATAGPHAASKLEEAPTELKFTRKGIQKAHCSVVDTSRLLLPAFRRTRCRNCTHQGQAERFPSAGGLASCTAAFLLGGRFCLAPSASRTYLRVCVLRCCGSGKRFASAPPCPRHAMIFHDIPRYSMIFHGIP